VQPINQRIDELLSRLTVAEQIAMLHQYSPAVPRLGLEAFRTGTEALHGLAWLGPATVFPQAVGLGATWNPELVERVGEVVGTEVRARHAADPTVSLNVWAPVVNLLRDPRWGRNEEGYSEDPLHTARLAIAYCRGLRGTDPDGVRTAPSLKHFQAYNNETERDRTSSTLRPRVQYEYDLPVFRDPLRAGLVDAVMPSYNLVNGRPTHLSPLLNRLLRAWAPHELLVVSDAEAPGNLVEGQQYLPDHETGHAAALLAGVDSYTERGDDPSFTIETFTAALERGLIGKDDVERAVRRVLTIRARTGEFTPELDPYATIGPESLDRPEHRELARETAREQVVLLKNTGRRLPLDVSAGLRVAVVGPFADTLGQDWYSGTLPYRVSLADGLRPAIEAAGGTLVSLPGVDRIALRVAGSSLTVSLPDSTAPILTCIDSQILDAMSSPAMHFELFDWGAGVCTLRAVSNGRYVSGPMDGGPLVADQVQPNGWEVRETFGLLAQDDGTVVLRHLVTGHYVRRDGELLAPSAERLEDATRFTKLLVNAGLDDVREVLRAADLVIVALGNDPHINGRETQDRSTLALPPSQEALLRAVTQVRPDPVLILMSSYPYTLTWADAQVPAIIWTSHAGQETGNALADVLLGRHSPTGRLPQTWYRSDDDLPDLLEYDVIKARRTYQYFDGTALYPFGHGLTYTTFDYGPAEISGVPVEAGPPIALTGPAPDHAHEPTVTVLISVLNSGERPATDVVQLYTRFTGSAFDRPQRRLQTWQRVSLAPGEAKAVRLEFPVSGLAHWDVARHEYRVDPGAYEVLVGRSSQDVRSVAGFDVIGETARPRLVIGISAADFDDYNGITLVDTTRETGDAVQTVDPAGAWLLFRAMDLRANPTRLTARVSRDKPDPAPARREPQPQPELELRLDALDGPRLATAPIPVTGDRYGWAQVSTELAGADGVHDVYLLLRGRFRIDVFSLRD
jgi:beta-glucosidase